VEESGKRRLHKPPNRTEIVACRHWLEAELVTVKPVVVVALGR
jgi:uracil-DNA glycosylase